MAASDDNAGVPRTPSSSARGSVSAASPTPHQPRSPPLPPPRRKAGSVHTAYYPPTSEVVHVQPLVPSPPPYDGHASDAQPPYREPVGLPSSPATSIPDLIEADQNGDPKYVYSSWENAANAEWQTQQPIPSTWGEAKPTWDAGTGTGNSYSGWANATTQEMVGAIESPEDRWWDRDSMHTGWVLKPGPGFLPPAVAQRLHGSGHALVKVVVTPPDIPPEYPAPPRSPVQPLAALASPTAPSMSPASSSPGNYLAAAHSPPTREEILMTVPHPYAQYCRQDNVWVYHQVKASVHLPPMVPLPPGSYPIPDQAVRKSCSSCIDLDDAAVNESLYLSSNQLKTHHFHHYPNSVKGSLLSPPFTRALGGRSRKPGKKGSTASTTSRIDMEIEMSPSDATEELLLDLWVCCQCQTHIIASGENAVIPGVVDTKVIMAYIRERNSNPPAGKNAATSLMYSLDTMLRILENFIFKLNGQAVKVGSSLQSKVGWNDQVKQIFHMLGFEHQPATGAGLQTHPLGRLAPPKLDDRPGASLKRARLLRGWLEFSVMAAELRKRCQADLRDFDTGHPLWVTVETTSDETLRQIGAHPLQVKQLSMVVRQGIPSEYLPEWDMLGTTAETHAAELVEFAYRRQTYCNPKDTPYYYNSLDRIRQWASAYGHSSQEGLNSLCAMEMSRGRWSSAQLAEAWTMLGLGPLSESFDPLVEIKDAWLAKVKACNAVFASGNCDKNTLDRTKQDLKEAYRIVSESTGRADVVRSYEETLKLYGNGMFDVNEAYATLELPRELDEEMVVTIFGMRLDDQPSQAERMRSALLIIAEDRESARLKNLALTGRDDGPPPPESSRLDWPRGLQQLGNTCYLNSLLQYFYTIKDLRDAISSHDPDAVVDLSDEDIKQDRVGGRLVTRREVERSKKFVTLLRDLFWQLEWSQDIAIKPELELAKLALVTSKDEEDEVKSEGSDATNSSSIQSGSTLVDEPMPMGPVPEFLPDGEPNQSPPPPSVLGKRPGELLDRERRHTTMDMEISSSELVKEDFVVIEPPRRAVTNIPDRGGDQVPLGDMDVVMEEPSQGPPDVNMQRDDQTKPPPLPPRKKPEQGNDSVMMFGKQHDVSECMDNCMFQIEAAMKFGLEKDAVKSSDAPGSVVKKLFYGKIRQRIEVLSELSSEPSVHEKEDLFSQLLVNVADEGYDLYDGLSGHFDDNVEFEGKQGRMETSIVELPPLLQIQLQRVQFNRDTLEAYKSNAYVKFGESLFVDRFLSSANPEKKARAREIERDLRACRDRLSSLLKGKGGTYERVLNDTYNMLSQQNFFPVEMTLLADISQESELLKTELVECRKQAASLKTALEDLWKDEQNVEYELSSVFIHRGASPSFGHYFFYSRDLPENPDRWLKYNDQDVAGVPKSEVLVDTTGSTANPYLLVFARKGTNVINAIHRTNFEELEVEMTDS